MTTRTGQGPCGSIRMVAPLETDLSHSIFAENLHSAVWFLSILAGKMGSVDFDRRNGFGRFRPKKVGLVDFDRTNWFRSILAKKPRFG